MPRPVETMQRMPLQKDNRYLPMALRYQTEIATNNLHFEDIKPPSKPIIRVPFEAYITITRESSTSEPPESSISPVQKLKHNSTRSDGENKSCGDQDSNHLQNTPLPSNRDKNFRKRNEPSKYNTVSDSFQQVYSYFLHEVNIDSYTIENHIELFHLNTRVLCMTT